jgi:hypothetical protein
MPKSLSDPKARCRFTYDLFEWVKADDHGDNSLAEHATARPLSSPSWDLSALSQALNPDLPAGEEKPCGHGC